MAKLGLHHCSIALQALTVFSVLVVLVADVQGGDGCPGFSCGHLRDVRYPFRRPGDPPGCGVQAYQLVCSSSKAIIHINTGTYYVTGINYTDSSFWVVDANFNASSSCPLPRRNQVPYTDYLIDDSRDHLYLATDANWACFANCSRAITSNMYKAVTCLSASNSHVYVWVSSRGGCFFQDLRSSCSYLAMIPFGVYRYFSYDQQVAQNASYADIIGFIRKGFSVQFPIRNRDHTCSEAINICLNNSVSYFKEQTSDASILKQAHVFFWSDIYFGQCVRRYYNHFRCRPINILLGMEAVVSAMSTVKLLIVLCRFMLAPLAVLIFLAYKYWKTRITIDAVEKFLRMQQMIGPMRYAYTEIVAVTSHFRDKLGQGGYGSVYKGVLLPGDLHVAVKMLQGNANCNGEDFISEVSPLAGSTMSMWCVWLGSARKK